MGPSRLVVARSFLQPPTRHLTTVFARKIRLQLVLAEMVSSWLPKQSICGEIRGVKKHGCSSVFDFLPLSAATFALYQWVFCF